MFDWLDQALESFWRTSVPLPLADVAVSFDAPDRAWSARLDGPTVNAFLWDIRRLDSLARRGLTTVTDEDGNVQRRLPAPWFDLHYLVSAWTADVRDEHRLLGRLVLACVGEPQLEPGHLPPGLTSISPPRLSVGGGSGPVGADPWSLLDGQLKATLDLVVSLEVDAALTLEAGPPVARVDLSVRQPRGDRVLDGWVSGAVVGPAASGATVVSPRGSAIVQPDGCFVLRARAGDEIVVSGDPPRRATVPPNGPVLVG